MGAEARPPASATFKMILNPVPALLQASLWELVKTSQPIPIAVMSLLLIFSVLSWAIIFSKWRSFNAARTANRQFLRVFRKAGALEQVALAAEQFRAAPLVAVFDFGYSEVDRQRKMRGRVSNPVTLERNLQLGISEEVAKLERNMNWLATTATVSPFIGLFGTVWGIIDAFQALGLAGATSMRAVAPGIAHALVATALGLAAAIPAAVSYNHFGHVLKELGARMEDFSLEFLNLAERDMED
jgi:biopolymer transport protein TolQ